MQALAQKQNQPQKRASSSLARPNTATPGPTHHAYPIPLLPRAIGNQAVQRVLQTPAEELEVGLTAAASPRFGHDFSQIPIHPPATRATQTKPAFNKPGDEYEQEADAREGMEEMGSAPISPPAAPGLQSDYTRIPITALPIQHKPTVNSPGDPFEREADDVADKVMRIAEPVCIDSTPPAIQRKCTECEDEEKKPLQTKRAPSANTEAGLDAGAAVRATNRGGAPLSREVRSYFELCFRHDFSDVRVHADGEAANAASAVRARAYTIGRNIVFGSGEYAPATTKGKRLLAHELAHVVQQEQGPHRGIVMRQRAAAQQAPTSLATVEEAAEFLEDMARFIENARSFALAVVQPTSGTATTPAARQRAHRMLNQQRLRDLLANARTAFAVQEPALQGGDPRGTRLRAALLGVIAKIREVAPDALRISDGMPAPTPDDERRLNAELVVDLIEADPFTSAGMVGTPAFGAAETGAGASHEAFIEAYLDDLIRTLPGQTLAPADRDRILQRINAALRRAFLTVGTGPAGTPDIRAITNPAIVVKYRRVTELLSAGMSARPAQLSIITESLPAYVLPPDPVPDVTPQLRTSPNIGMADLSRVPAIELPYVRYGVLQAANTILPAAIQRRNASWPVALQVRRGGNV